MIGVNHQNMNETNKFLLLKTVVTQGPISRIALSKKTKLSKMTVTSLIGEYIENGIIRECGIFDSHAGRKPTLLEAVPDSLLTLGISIGRDFLEVGAINLCGKINVSERMILSEVSNGEELVNSLLFLCDSILNRIDKSKIWGIGIASIGPLDVHKGIIVNPPNFNGIENVPIIERLKEKYNLPIYLENDMCVSSLAELYFGYGKKYQNFVFVGISAGIGSGIIINSRLYNGTRGLAGCIGHLVMEPDGLLCHCGNKGCLESYASTRATIKWAVEHGAPSNISWIKLLDSARNGDPICINALDHMATYLEMAVINIVSMIDCQCIFIGGDAWFGEEFFLERLNSALKVKCFAPNIGNAVPVILSQFPGNSAFIGTAALVMENNLNNQQ